MKIYRGVCGVLMIAGCIAMAAAEGGTGEAPATSSRHLIVLSRAGAEWVWLDSGGSQLGPAQPLVLDRTVSDALLGLAPEARFLMLYDETGSQILEEELEVSTGTEPAMPLIVRLVLVEKLSAVGPVSLFTWDGVRYRIAGEHELESEVVAPVTSCTPGDHCSDGHYCTVNDRCNDQGVCTGEPRNCDDGRSCTSDGCIDIIGCFDFPSRVVCNDGDPCTGPDSRYCTSSTCEPGPNLCPTIFSPNGGETLSGGSTTQIFWSPVGNATDYRIKISFDKGQSWHTLADNVPGTSYDWQIPVYPRSRRHCLLKVIARRYTWRVGADRSDAVFSILAPREQ